MTQNPLSVAMIDGTPPSPEDMQRAFDQVDRFNAELQSAGTTWVFAGGLMPASSATVVRAEGDEILVTDGPFTESKEHIGGFWVIEAADLDAALAWATKATRAGEQPVEADRSRRTRRADAERAPARSAVPRSSESSARSTDEPSSVLVRAFGDIDLAEEGVQDAFTIAATHWLEGGLPPRPAGWIITTARNRIVDRLRREASREDRQVQGVLLHQRQEPDEELAVQDDRLRLMFTCCHPALAPAAQVALTLRLLGGSRRPRSPVPSWSPRRPWPNASSGPRPRSATPASPTGSRAAPCCRTGSVPCWR